MSFQERYYQPEAVDAVFRRWDAGDRGTLCWLATGMGKTVIAAMVTRRIVEGGGRPLFIAHREDLLDGAESAMRRELDGIQVRYELNVNRVSEWEINQRPPDAVVASVQSVHKRLEKYPADFFSHIIVDEAHRGAAATYLKIVHHFPEAKLLYLTATPGRSDSKTLSAYTYDESAELSKDQKALLAMCCQSTAYAMPRAKAEQDGWLVPFKPGIVHVDVDWSTLKIKGGDFSKEDVDKIMREDGPLHKVALGLQQRVAGKRGVVFMPGVDSAKGLAQMLTNTYGIEAMSLDGKTEKNLRREIIARAKSGDLPCLVNVGVAVEGFDSPCWEYVADCQPTKHIGRYEQKLGRGVRPLDPAIFDGLGGPHQAAERRAAIAQSAKPFFWMLDFVGNMGKLGKPISSFDVMMGEVPHHDYKGQPKPSDANVKSVMQARPRLSLQEARQRASDEQYLHELIMSKRWSAEVEGEVRVQEFESWNTIPFVWTPPTEKTRKMPEPGQEASDKQKGFIKWQYRLQGKREPSKEWLDSLSKKQAGRIINELKAAAGMNK